MIDWGRKWEGRFLDSLVPVCSKIDFFLEQDCALQRQAKANLKSAFVPKFGGGCEFLFYIV